MAMTKIMILAFVFGISRLFVGGTIVRKQQ